ncbi:hypothetical protein CFB46_08505 [Burkholderia sp. HI2761]|nr:hypothetical protein CFB46_08505 [Burkholderia sp. HI2761]
MTQRVTVRRILHGVFDGLCRSPSQRYQTLVFCVGATAYACLAQCAKAPAFLHRGLERYLYRFPRCLRVPTKACGVVIPRRVFCLAIELSEPHESCSWEMI